MLEGPDMGEELSVLEEMKEGLWASACCTREYKISEYVKKAGVKKKGELL